MIDTTVDKGLLRRWCYGVPGEGCSHYITTREDTSDTENCNVFDKNILNKNDVLAFLRHQPHCLNCLTDMNSYIFPAWYDISREEIDTLAALYEAYYPNDILQPFFHISGDSECVMRLENTHDVNGYSDASFKMDIMQAEFWVQASDAEWEHYIFDMYDDAGWRAMLRVFPQKSLKEMDNA